LGGIAGLAGIARAKVAGGQLDEAETMLAAIERQVFANLVGNACKFVRGRSAGRVEGGHASTSNGHAYFVRDNGIGFAPADAARLFRPFERLNGQRFKGAGVGLSIVKRIIDHHGGRVWAEGTPGAGATFWFTLG
jgi:signal transduction histidine kinase